MVITGKVIRQTGHHKEGHVIEQLSQGRSYDIWLLQKRLWIECQDKVAYKYNYKITNYAIIIINILTPPKYLVR